jgi:hypothetical protein
MDSLLVGKSDSPCLKQDQITVFSVQRRSAACGKHSEDRERDSGPKRKVFAIAPERRSPSSRNGVRNQPGIVFGFNPESRSASPGFPMQPIDPMQPPGLAWQRRRN